MKEFIFTSRPFQPKAGLPRGGGVKKNTLAVKQQVGFEPGTFWSTVECLATVSLQPSAHINRPGTESLTG